MLPKLNHFNPVFDPTFCGDDAELDSDDCYLETLIEGSLDVKLPTIWTDEKQSREEAERREKIREEKESAERRYRCAKR